MPVNVSNRKPNFKNTRSKSLNYSRKKQSLNLQTVRLTNGEKIRVSAKELRSAKKDQKVEI